MPRHTLGGYPDHDGLLAQSELFKGVDEAADLFVHVAHHGLVARHHAGGLGFIRRGRHGAVGQAHRIIEVHGLFLLLSTTGLKAAGNAPSDQEIARAVEMNLYLDDGVASHLIDVTCKDGIVELKGWVDSLLARHRAPRIARTTRGVRSVVNDVKVRTPHVEDDKLEQRVRGALRNDPASELRVRSWAEVGMQRDHVHAPIPDDQTRREPGGSKTNWSWRDK